MLLIKPNCEMCGKDLPPHSAEAVICSYECTFCERCAQGHLQNVCPNCGGGFAPRPIRPAHAHRDGTGLHHHPASTTRSKMEWTSQEIAAFVAQHADTPPSER